MKPISFKRHRFPPDVIRLGVWLYYRFTLSLRDVEDLLAERGIDLCYETVRCWANKFGPAIAANIRRKRGRADSVWHLDEMVVRINGQRMYMWRAVDKEGEVLDILVQKRRNKAAALKLEPRRSSRCHRHRRTAILPCRFARVGRPPPTSTRSITRQQSGGKFAPSRPKTGAKDATVQIPGPGSTLRFHPQRNLQYVRHPASPRFPKHNATFQRPRVCGVERCVRCRSVRFQVRDFVRPASVKLTMPSQTLRPAVCAPHVALFLFRQQAYA